MKTDCQMCGPIHGECADCENKRLKTQNEILHERIQEIIDYPTEQSTRRTEDGYPAEVVYDEMAYKRMVDSYREGLTQLLAQTKEGDKWHG